MNFEFPRLSPHPHANKYSRGKLVVVAGSARYPGAAALAARASQRTGAGYTEVVTAKTAVDAVRAVSPSLVVRSITDWDPSEIPASKEGKPTAVCIGPGFEGKKKESELVARVLSEAQCPVIIDGGGLAALGKKEVRACLASRIEAQLPCVITPHGGEAALRVIVVLKGPDTYISDGIAMHLMNEGTAALAKAGTGDVLAGMIGALLAQGIPAYTAAIAGCVLHARAGILAAEQLTDVSVTAEDVMNCIPAALKCWFH